MKRKIMSMRFLTTLERGEDGAWIAECPSIPGCFTQGESRDEGVANSVKPSPPCLEVRADRGMPLTIKIHQVEVAV